MSLDLLVVGAGPTGLTLAMYAAQHGLSVRIVDKLSGPSPLSRALAVQAGTMEALADAFGFELPAALIEQGRMARGLDIHIDHREPTHVDLSMIDTAYNGILVVTQADTERLLTAELGKRGVRVEWGRELFGVDSPETPVARVAGESIAARFVVGCDGAHSGVRRAMGIGFAGRQYDGLFILADAKIAWPWAYGGVRTFISAHGALACFPFREEQHYRLVCLRREGDVGDLDAAKLQQIVDQMTPADVRVLEHTWLANFRVSHRIVDHWRRGNVFLAGDAAHIHSPVGGQGMNTGIQDALCLGDLLRRVVKSGAHPRTLRRYEQARSKVARNVLRGTDLPFRFLLEQGSPLSRMARGVVLPKLVASTTLQRRVMGAVSELAVARREIAVRRTASG